MSETTLGVVGVIALVICIIDCLFWMLGGREGKYKRRFIGSGIQFLGVNVLSLLLGTWVWQNLLIIFSEIASRSMGYGVNDGNIVDKVFRRSVFALGSLATGVILAWGLDFSGKAIVVLVCQLVASIVSVILGVKNPFPAAIEEVFVCLSLKYLNYGYIFVALS